MSEYPDLKNDVDFYFNKKFSFKKSDSKLPTDKSLYLSSNHPKINIPALQSLKHELNRVKSKLNDFEMWIWFIIYEIFTNTSFLVFPGPTLPDSETRLQVSSTKWEMKSMLNLLLKHFASSMNAVQRLI